MHRALPRTSGSSPGPGHQGVGELPGEEYLRQSTLVLDVALLYVTNICYKILGFNVLILLTLVTML